MKNKTTTHGAVIALASLFLFSANADAQMVPGGAFMKGNYIEIGIDSAGGFEGTSATAITGLHPRSNNPLFGFVANPQMDFWTNYDGDFFTPGSPENGWGYTIGAAGTEYNNNCSIGFLGSAPGVPGAITAWSYSGGQILCDWEGDDVAAGLHFKINYDLHDNDLFYITTVSVTNTGSSAITDFYYHRNLDPDNNIMLSGDYSTQNTIVSQITLGGSNTSVKATQTTPWNSLFEFIAVDPDWVAGYGGFSNRDAYDAYNGTGFTQTVGATNFADEAIYLAYKIPTLAPATTGTFKFASAFSPSGVTAAVAAMSSITTSVADASIEDVVSVYPNPMDENSTITIAQQVQLNNASFHVYDVVGREVVSMSVEGHSFKFNKNLPKGAYIYKVNNNGKEIAVGKMLKN